MHLSIASTPLAAADFDTNLDCLGDLYEAILPRWPGVPASPDVWTQIWSEAEQLPLQGSVSAHLRLFLLHRPKRALLQVRGQATTTTRHPTVYTDIASAPNFEDEEEEVQLPEGCSDPCPEGCPSRDTVCHGFWECGLVKRVWKEALAVLGTFCPKLAAEACC